MKNLKSFEESLVKLAKKYQNMVVLNGDFSDRLGVNQFISFYPERSFKFGLSERAVVTSSVGFLLRGKLPVVVGFTAMLMKAFDVLANEIVAANLNIKFVIVAEEKDNFEFLSSVQGLKTVRLNYDSDAGEVFDEMLSEYGPAVMIIAL